MRLLFILFTFLLFSCQEVNHKKYDKNLLVFKELIFNINTYFKDSILEDPNISQYYTDNFIFHSYPAGYKKGQATLKTDYINGLKAMKSMGYVLNIGHSIYLPGINQETFDIDGSVRVYYGATISLDTSVVEFSGYQTIDFNNGAISEIWEWADYGGVANQIIEINK